MTTKSASNPLRELASLVGNQLVVAASPSAVFLSCGYYCDYCTASVKATFAMSLILLIRDVLASRTLSGVQA